jgi:hypothetical protein
MADFVDSLTRAVAGERPNIFAAPDGAAQVADMAVAGAQPSSVFIARDSSDRRRDASVRVTRGDVTAAIRHDTLTALGVLSGDLYNPLRRARKNRRCAHDADPEQLGRPCSASAPSSA